MNTLEHGLCSVPHEDGAAYYDLRASRHARVSGVRIWDSVRFAKTLSTAGFPFEIAQSCWRIQRKRRLEVAFFNMEVGNLKDRNGIGIDPEPPAPVCDIIYTEQRDGEARRPGV